MATILTKKSDTASSVPSAAQLTNSATGAELAVNTADKRLYTKDSGGNVVELGTNPSSLTLPNGTANGLAFLNASKVLTTGSALTFDGTNLTVSNAGAQGFEVRPNSGDYSGGINLFSYNRNTSAWAPMGQFASYFAWQVGASEQMRLTSTGLGIGTSSPNAPLTFASATGRKVGFYQATQGYSIGVESSEFRFVTDSSAVFSWRNGSTYSTATEYMRLDSSGNLGLGVTPSAWLSTAKAIDIGANSAFFNASNNASVGNNVFLNASSQWIYKNTAAAALYQQVTGQHIFYTAPSGTAGNAISFTQAMTLDASGNWFLGGTTTPFTSSGRTVATINGSSQALLGLTVGGVDKAYLYTDGTNTTLSNSPAGALIFATNAGTERARIDSSGNLLVGASGGYNGERVLLQYTGNGMALRNLASGTNNDVVFLRGSGNTVVGSIQTSATATTYNTSSDYRLKNITGPVINSGAYIDSLKPVEGTWKADGSTFVGLIAHEVQEVSRTQVATGEKDGAEMQAMDYSSAEIIANLIAEVQSLRKRLAALEAA